MPELPEIETVKLQLQKHLLGKTITGFERLHPKSVVGDVKKVLGKKILDIQRIGKMLIFKLSGDVNLAIHFKMTGQLVLKKSKIKNQKSKIKIKEFVKEFPNKHTRAIFHLHDKSNLYFNDQRLFGYIKILDGKSLKQLSFLKEMGKEPWDVTDEEFYNLIHKRKKAIKLVIIDQAIISGVGNIYANDALWEAGILPTRKAQSLASKEAKLLRKSIIKVLKEGIKYGGASASDDKYVNLYGKAGKYQDHFRVYDREKLPCLKCKTPIKKIKLGGRGTYFCPVCQK